MSGDENDEWEARRVAAEEWCRQTEESFPEERMRDLGEATYTFSEMGLWLMDDISIDPEVAIRIWAVVEHVRRHGFPDDLRM